MVPFNIATLAGYRRCYFVLRTDHVDKPGGDVDLAHQIARTAQAAGAVATVLGIENLPAVLDEDELLFLFNIDRPHEAAAALARLHPRGRALLYPLHHPAAGVAAYLARARGAKRVLGLAAGGRPERYEALVDMVKAVRAVDGTRMRTAIGRGRIVARLIDRCELIVTSAAELAEIRAHYGPPARAVWQLPHPVAPYAAAGGIALPRYLLVPGRIELRKNQLAALQTLVAMKLHDRGYELVLAGGRGTDAAYFRDTIDFALANRVIYVSQLPKTLFFPAVSGAALVVNASFFEVTSLIDLYAIRNGIPLVTTTYGYYDAAPALRQVDPLAWGTSPAAAATGAIEALLPHVTPGGQPRASGPVPGAGPDYNSGAAGGLRAGPP